MKAIILAGGRGERLRPFSDTMPKSVVPVEKYPFLWYVLRYLKTQDIHKIVMLTGYQADKIKETLGAGGQMNLSIEYQAESEPLGTGGALLRARNQIDEDVLVLNGDTYCELNVSDFYAFHRKNQADFTIAVVKAASNKTDFGLIAMNSKNQVLQFREKQRGSGYSSAGFYIVSPRLFSRFSFPHSPCSLEKDLIPSWLGQSVQIYGFPISENKFFDIGTPERFNEFRNFIKGRSQCV